MPIKPDALGAAPPKDETPAPKRKRRSKEEVAAEKIAKAKIPNDDDEVTVVFAEAVGDHEAGTTAALLWPEALTHARNGTVTLSEGHELARKRLDLEAAQSEQQEDDIFKAGIFPKATEKFPVTVEVDGEQVEAEWEFGQIVQHVIWNKNTNLTFPAEIADDIARLKAVRERDQEQGTTTVTTPPQTIDGAAIAASMGLDTAPDAATSEPDGEGDLQVEPGGEAIPIIEQVNPGVWKVGMGYLEKIGLPEYSSLAIGPCTASTHVIDDGRRATYKVGRAGEEQEVQLPAAVVEKLQEAGQICETVMRAERASLITYLEMVKPQS